MPGTSKDWVVKTAAARLVPRSTYPIVPSPPAQPTTPPGRTSTWNP